MHRKPNILVVGSFMMDLIASTHKAPQSGETVKGIGFSTAPGGKGANQAVQCARLGANVTMAGKVGKDAFGDFMLKTAYDAGVNVSHVLRDDKEPSGVGHITLEITENSAQNRITICPGANSRITEQDMAWLKDEIGRFDIVMLQFEIPMEINELVAGLAFEAGVPVMVNPAPAADIPESLLAHTTYLSPNEHEAALLTGHKIDVTDGVNYKDLEIVADNLINRGVKNLIVTLGENGSIIADGKALEHIECVRVDKVADPTAAGDSFVAAFCTALSAGIPKNDALVFASHVSSLTVTKMGAMPSLPTISEVREYLARKGRPGFHQAELDALEA